MSKISGHSGLSEKVELRIMSEKYEAVKSKRKKQIDDILSILRTMPKNEAYTLLAQVFREYKFTDNKRNKIMSDWQPHAPTIDATPVVRCKDCKWFTMDNTGGAYCNHPTCGLFNGYESDAFCSYGERKEKINVKE